MAMNIFLNGKKEDLAKSVTISELLKVKKIRPEVVTVELNDAVIEKAKYDDTFIKDKDMIEFVYYMGGGEYAF